MAKTETTPSAVSQSAMTFAPGPKNVQRLSGAIDGAIANRLREIVDASGTVTNTRVYPSKDDKQFRLDRNFMRKHLAATFDTGVHDDGTPDVRYYRADDEMRTFFDYNTAILEGAFNFVNAETGEIVTDLPDTPIVIDDHGNLVMPDGIAVGSLTDEWAQMPHAATHRVRINYYGKPDAVEFSLDIATRRSRSNGDDEDGDEAETETPASA